MFDTIPLQLAQALAPAAPATGPASDAIASTASIPFTPVVIIILCAVAGVGTLLLLPGRREAAIRKIGGTILIVAGLIFAALLARWTAGTGGGGMNVYFWIFSAIALVGAVRVVTHPRPVYSALYFVMTVFASAGLFVLLWAEFMAAALIIIYAGAILITYVFVIMLASEATNAAAGQTGSLAGLSEHDSVSREPLFASAVGFVMMGVMLFVIFDKAQPVGRNFSAAPAASNLVPQLNALLATREITPEGFTVPATQPAGLNGRGVMSLKGSIADEFVVASDIPSVGVKPRAEVVTGGTQKLGEFLFRNHMISLELGGLILTIAMVGAIMIARRNVIVGGSSVNSSPEVVVGPATPLDDNPHSIPVYGTTNPRQKEYPEA